MRDFLRSTPIIDFNTPNLASLARELGGGDARDIAERCFLWVRDRIDHCIDAQRGPVVCRASDVLREGVGYCYGKSHLLTALLRANGVPAGLRYQRLTCEGTRTGMALHGLVAVHLPDIGWYRVDPRGNKPGVDAQFCPPVEKLAFAITAPGEYDLPDLYADPLPCVVAALSAGRDWRETLHALPDDTDL